MGRTRLPYPPEFREQMVALVRSGRTPESLSREFEPTAQTIHNWVKQADLDAGRHSSPELSDKPGAVHCELVTCVPLPAFWRVDSSARLKTRRRVNSDPTFAPPRRLAGRARSRQTGACPERGEL